MEIYKPVARIEGKNTVVNGIKNFSLADTLDCGQAFRFSENPDGSWSGIAFGRPLKLATDGDELTFFNTTPEQYHDIWENYFDLGRDYGKIIAEISENEVLRRAAEYGNGIRVMKQDNWEALCSFIISQNNNIPRIKGIIERLCENFGEKIPDGYTFPSAERLAALTPEDLAPLRAGFRARYIIDAAQKVAGGRVNLEKSEKMPLEEARQMLMGIVGVGEKVADCALLFGAGRTECFPKDVWIKRAMEQLFGGELPECALPYAGIVQQYIFHYARTSGIFQQ